MSDPSFITCPNCQSERVSGERFVKSPDYWFSRTCRAQLLPYTFVKKSRKNKCFHQELFIAFNSLFLAWLRGDRGDLHKRAIAHLCLLTVCAGRVSGLSRSLATSSQLLSALTTRLASERSGGPITASCATISLSQHPVLAKDVRGTVARSRCSHCSTNHPTDGALRRVRH